MTFAYGFHLFQVWWRNSSRIDERLKLRDRLRASGHLPPPGPSYSGSVPAPAPVESEPR